jgi:hypothetical protein
LGDFLGNFSLSLGDFFTKTSGHPDNNPNKKAVVVATIENETSGQDFKAYKQEVINFICTLQGSSPVSTSVLKRK